LDTLRAGQVGVWKWTFATGRVRWSETLETICGLAPHSFPGTLEAVLDLMPTDDRAIWQARLERYRAAPESGSAEFRIVRPNGLVRWLMGTGSVTLDRSHRPTGMAGICLDVTDYKYAEGVRWELQRQLVGAQEEERRRISRELHDHLGQHLAALILGLQELRESAAEGVDRSRLLQLQLLANAMASEVHDFALELRPAVLDDLGLYSALEQYAEQWSARHDIPVEMHAAGLAEQRLPPAIEIALYRIAQEGLTNVARHAAAAHVSLIVERTDDGVQLILEDDGRGFPVDAVPRDPLGTRRLGLVGMRERAALAGGTLDIESSPGRGTTLFARIPLSPKLRSLSDR
jgi:PAS domain S-box-containing protein